MSITMKVGSRYKTREGEELLCTQILEEEGFKLAVVMDTAYGSTDIRSITGSYFLRNEDNNPHQKDIVQVLSENSEDDETEASEFSWFSGTNLLRVNESGCVTFLSFSNKEEMTDYIPEHRASGVTFHYMNLEDISPKWREI